MVFRRSLQLRPVKSIKHVVDIQSAVVTSGISTAPLIETVATAGVGSPTQVEDGATVSAIYLRVEALATETFSQQPAFYFIIFKDPGNHLADDPVPSLVGISENRRWVIHQEMAMLQQTVDGVSAGFPRTIFQGVIKIPPRLKRFGFGDKLKLLAGHQAAESTGTSQFCVQCIYKEFR